MKITSPWIDDIFTRFKIISWITLTLESSCNEQNNKRPNFLSKKRKMLTININIFCLQINYPLKSTSLTNNVISKIDMLVAKSKGYILKLKPWIPHPPKRKSKTMLGVWFKRNEALENRKDSSGASYFCSWEYKCLNTKLTSSLSMGLSGSYSRPFRQTQHTASWTRWVPSLPEGLSYPHTCHTRQEPYATKQKLQMKK